MGEKKDQKKEEIRYHNDYSPRYHSPYDIYEKARNHMKGLKRREEEENLKVKPSKSEKN